MTKIQNFVSCPWSVSAAVHTFILIVLGLWSVSLREAAETTIKLDWKEEVEEVTFSEIEVMEIEEIEEKDQEVEGGAVEVEAFTEVEVEAPEFVEPLAEALNDPVDYSLKLESAAPTTISSGTGSVMGPPQGSEGTGPGTGRGTVGPTVNFFGSQARAQKIVYVVDGSESMKLMIRGTQRIALMKKELLRSVRALHSPTSFSILLFDAQTEEDRSLEEYTQATPENLRQVLPAIRRITLGGCQFAPETVPGIGA